MRRSAALGAGVLLAATLLAGCAVEGGADPRCAEASDRFDAVWPAMANAFGQRGARPDEMRVEIAAGAALSAVRPLPNPALRETCYGSLMRSHGFSNYPPYG